ncbi:MAG: hypothetical protein K6G08_05950 [Prevotella sp.]|nr:hypothetical protein [Prevotella sp.]
MRHILYILILAAALGACGKKESASEPELKPEELAAKAATTAYDALYHGDTQKFLDTRLHAADMPQDFRLAMLQSLAQHVAQVKSERQGVNKVEVTRTEVDPSLGIIQVFLLLSYGNGTQEEIVVPMVEHKGQWCLK